MRWQKCNVSDLPELRRVPFLEFAQLPLHTVHCLRQVLLEASLGRFAHDPVSLEAVLDEAAVLAIERAEGLDT